MRTVASVGRYRAGDGTFRRAGAIVLPRAGDPDPGQWAAIYDEIVQRLIKVDDREVDQLVLEAGGWPALITNAEFRAALRAAGDFFRQLALVRATAMIAARLGPGADINNRDLADFARTSKAEPDHKREVGVSVTINYAALHGNGSTE